METCVAYAEAPVAGVAAARRGPDLVWGGGALTAVLLGCAIAIWRSYLRARAFCRALETTTSRGLHEASFRPDGETGRIGRWTGRVQLDGEEGVLSPVSGRRCALVEIGWRQAGREEWRRLGGARILLRSESSQAAIAIDEARLELATRPIPEEAMATVSEACAIDPCPPQHFDPYRALVPLEPPVGFVFRELVEGEPLCAVGLLRGDPHPAEGFGPFRLELAHGATIGGAEGAPVLLRPANAPAAVPPRALVPFALVLSLLSLTSAVLTLLPR